MEDIKVGEYVRINNDFRLIALGIGQVIRISQDTIYVKMNFELPFAFKKDNISKHSKKLIDLIEEGDFVNGKKISSLKGDIDLSDVNDENDFCYTDYSDEYGEWYGIKEDEVKTILTHEQYEANCYKVKGE